MIRVQRISVRKSRRLSRRKISHVSVSRVSRLSSQMARLVSQSNLTEQQQTNSGNVNGVQTSIFPSYQNRLRTFSSPPNQPHSTGVMQRQSLKQNQAAVPYLRTLTSANVRNMHWSKASMFTTSIHSKSSIHVSPNSRKSNLIFPSSNIVLSRKQAQHQAICKIDLNRSIWTTKEDRRSNRRRNRRVGCFCLRCCCLASIPLLALLLIGLAAMIFGLSTIGKTATTTTTTTPNTSFSTTSTTSISTTSATSTTSTTTTASEYMTEPEWNVTMQTTTTSNPCGTPTSIGSASNIFSTSANITSYTCEYIEWTSPTNGSVTLAFQFRNEPDQWNMDDVSVSNGTTEMLLNGGFESGSFSPGWTASTPNGNCVYSAHVVSSSCRTGNYCLSDGCSGRTDQISQSFVAIAGQSYFVSFWLKRGGGNGIVSASATLS